MSLTELKCIENNDYDDDDDDDDNNNSHLKREDIVEMMNLKTETQQRKAPYIFVEIKHIKLKSAPETIIDDGQIGKLTVNSRVIIDKHPSADSRRSKIRPLFDIKKVLFLICVVWVLCFDFWFSIFL